MMTKKQIEGAARLHCYLRIVQGYGRNFPKLDLRKADDKAINRCRIEMWNRMTDDEKSLIYNKAYFRHANKPYKFVNILNNSLVVDYLKHKHGNHPAFGPMVAVAHKGGRRKCLIFDCYRFHYAESQHDEKIIDILSKYVRCHVAGWSNGQPNVVFNKPFPYKIRVYQTTMEITTQYEPMRICFDGLKGELTWEDWKEDFEEFDAIGQKKIREEMERNQIITY